jgi:hypothetical protein
VRSFWKYLGCGGALLGLGFLLWLSWQGWQLAQHTLSGVDRHARQAAAVLTDVFQGQPRMVINQTIIWAATAPIAEFAVVSKEAQITVEWTNTQYGSQKTIQLLTVYRAKAGFDLREDFRTQINPQTGQFTVDLPPARLLSLELRDPIKIKSRSGWINWINDTDRAAALRYLHEESRRLVEKSGLLEEATAQALERLQTLADKQNPGNTFRAYKPKPE